MGGKPFYQRPWFLATAAVVALAGGTLTLVGGLSGTIGDLLADDVANYNTMIVLDASGRMRERFGEDGTKYDAAARAVKDYVAPFENQGFGLRTLGGRCPGPGRRRVDIGARHNDDVRDAVDEVNPRGEVNLTQTLLAATDDLADTERVPPGNEKLIVVFTGSGDTCGREATDTLRDQLRQKGVRTVLRIVAVDPTRRSLRKLRTFEKRLGRTADLQVADTRADLDRAVEDAQADTESLTTATTTDTPTTTTPETTTTGEPPPPPPTETTEQPEPTETEPSGE